MRSLFHTMTPQTSHPPAGPGTGASSLPSPSCCVTSAGAGKKEAQRREVKQAEIQEVAVGNDFSK